MKYFNFSIAAAAVALCLGTTGAATVGFEFNTVGNTEGWTASTAPNPNGVVTGFTAAVGIDGSTGVATSSDINIDPQIRRNGVGNVIALPTGELWDTVDIRFRQLDGNPGTPGTASAAYSVTGQILFFNGSLGNRTPGTTGISTQTYVGTGPYLGDSYAMTVTPEAGDWVTMTLDLSSAPILNSGDLTAVRFDPIGNNAAGNFEIDYIRFTSIPEPSTTLLSLFAAAGLVLRRRR